MNGKKLALVLFSLVVFSSLVLAGEFNIGVLKVTEEHPFYVNRRLTKPPTHPVRPVNPNNACRLRITAAAGTKLAVAASGGTVIMRNITPH